MKRREFLKVGLTTAAAALIPVSLLAPEKEVATVFIDNGTGFLSMEDLEQASLRVQEDYGTPDSLFMSKDVFDQFSKSSYPSEKNVTLKPSKMAKVHLSVGVYDIQLVKGKKTVFFGV